MWKYEDANLIIIFFAFKPIQKGTQGKLYLGPPNKKIIIRFDKGGSILPVKLLNAFNG